MIVPSIDLQGGSAVQLVQGREKKLDAGDPRPLAEQFALAGTVAVIDLDGAIETGENRAVIRELVQLAPCRVGGGIRDAATALDWLDAGATHVILGTAATPEVLRELPRDRVIVALDAWHDEVMVRGWREGTGRKVVDRLRELRELAGGFLITVIEREGCLEGVDFDRVSTWIREAGDARVTMAGGVSSVQEVARLDELGADAQVGMALYTGLFSVGDAVWECCRTDRPDGRVPTLVVDEGDHALGLAYSDAASLTEAFATRRGVYSSRSRGRWLKGESSGATQELLRVDLDCDRDTLRFTVRQRPPGFCHRGTRSCFGDARGLRALEETLVARRADAPAGSYTAKLFDDPELLRDKLREEAEELATAMTKDDIAHETADVLYFAMCKAIANGVSLADVEAVLEGRRRRVRRRSQLEESDR